MKNIIYGIYFIHKLLKKTINLSLSKIYVEINKNTGNI